MRPWLVLLGCLFLAPGARAADGNRLTYLDETNPWHPSRTFPKLVTPQWVGEEGVEAVVVLAIDDMRGHEAWERYLRPVLDRLKKIDGRAPVSIMTCSVDPKTPHLQAWLKEGLSLETHTIDHPCPLLGKGDLSQARSTYRRCIDLLADVPGNRPVAFRTPCCDSQNTPSPRLFTEIFRPPTERGRFLTIDSSVFNLPTADDPDLPRDLVFDAQGRERFRKYLPLGRHFANYISDYPYPYQIGNTCWEFPCATPSDWQGQNLHGKASPLTLADMKASLDVTVRKQGVWCLVFHPYGWVRPEQVVDLIDHAVAKYGKEVKFLTFREAHERLVKNLLAGQPPRAADGGDNGVRVLDLDGDGFMDVVIGNAALKQTRLWDAKERRWGVSNFPVSLPNACARFGVLSGDGKASLLVRDGRESGLWHFDGRRWVPDPAGAPVVTAREGKDQGVRLRDLDGDGVCELIVANPRENAVFRWSAKEGWLKLPFALPDGVRVVDASGRDAGLRFLEVDEDGHADLVFSADNRSSLHLFDSMEKGWARRVHGRKRGEAGALPPIVTKGTNNGFWSHARQLWWQNEHTALLPGLVERHSFNELLDGVQSRPKSPQASLRCLKPRPGFVAELAAAEPLVMDPIAFAFGPDGKLWVVEMGDYPLGVDGKGKPGGRVVFLEDTDGDGRYDRRTVFLDGLGFPTGVLPWRKGVLVTCAPDIFYAEDTDGDGKADKREVLYTGFREGNQQHRVNGLVWGLDNWLYVANGDSGGRVRSLKTGKVVDIAGRDLRIRPDTGDLDAQTGQTQFGRCRDDAGDWFGGNNSVPMWHYLLPDHYLRRNPHFAAPPPRVQVPAVPGTAPVFPISPILPRFNDPWAAGRFTSACSPIVYRDDLFPPPFARSLFVSEPVHNLVHRETITPEGVTFRGRRAADEQTSEFLASSDTWFRPTTLQTGPDGALWVADMYRAVIEHPEWIPKDVQKKLDLRAGHDKGRLYRVFPAGAKPRPIPRLDRLDVKGLVQALDSPSGWQRDTAQQMLLWRKDSAAIPHLKTLLSSPRPLARLHALCTLEGLGALTPELLAPALGDADAAVRRNAVRLCEGRLPGSDALAAAFLKCADDADAGVRMQLAFSLGEWADARAGRALGRLLARAAGDLYPRAACMTSLTRGNLDAVLAGVLEAGAPPAGLIEALMQQAGAMGHDRAILTLLDLVARLPKGEAPGWRLEVLAAFLDGLAARRSSLARLSKDGSEEMRAAVARLAPLFAAARAGALDEAVPEAERVRCVAVLGRGADQEKEDRDRLQKLLDPRAAPALQLAAVRGLARLDDAAVPAILLAGWKGHGPALRVAVLEAILQRPARVTALLDAVEKKRVALMEIDAAARQRLLDLRDAALRSRARKLLADAVAPDREKVLAAYKEALLGKGDAARGKAVFAKSCSACHRLEGVGHDVGPDLAALRDRTAEYLLVAILDPNRAVEARYLSYQAELADGRVLQGAITSETSTTLTLVGADGKAQVVLRSNVERLAGTGKSLMPEGLEKDVPVAAMADLLAYLRAQAPAAPPKSFPGNKPEPVRPSADGALRLTARNAEIRGRRLVLEEKYGNLGYWCNERDRAVWTLEVAKPGRYAVWLDYACDAAAAGNRFVLEAGEELLTASVASTGSWDVYKQTRAGEVTLPAGQQRLTMRSRGPIRGALLDLRSLRLVPEK
jgi:putative membrane-bound dehydrogenase-like protein